jgi:cyanophycinase
MKPSIAEEAEGAGFFYLVGGDPGLVAQVLRDSLVWRAMFDAWRAGAVLAGSSAGAMALCSHTLVRATWPNRFHRRPMEALGAVPRTAVLPHYDTFGHKWVDSAREAAPELTLLGVDERSAAVWQDGRWRAAGPGAVTVVKGTRTTRFERGAEVTGLRQPARMLPQR